MAVLEPSHAAASGLPAVVLRHHGLDPGSYRERPMSRRVAACLRALKAHSEAAAEGRLAANPALMNTALNALLIGVSDFFRDPLVFQTLREHAVPWLRGLDRPLRILSVGCSTGAELYSVAFLLADAGLLERSHLVGVDCRADAVAAAAAGEYTSAAVGTLDAATKARHFDATRDGWRVVPDIRRRTEWQTMDATRACPDGPWDIVLCRNVLIYLRHAAAEGLLSRLGDRLSSRGFLVLGKAERPPRHLGVRDVARCVYRAHDR